MDLQFTNADIGRDDLRFFSNDNGNERWYHQHFYTSHHRKCFTDLYPRDNIVYITSESNNELTYEADDIYVIPSGFFTTSPIATSDLDKMSIRHAKLPVRSLLG